MPKDQRYEPVHVPPGPQWRRYAGHGGMALPADIRAILEAAHIPWPEEPETGCTLRQVWERKAEARRQMPPRW